MKGCSRKCASRVCAFTIVELLVVIVVIGILMSLLLPAVQTSVAASRTAQCKSNQHQIGVALGNYLSTHNKAPDSVLLSGGLQSLVEKQVKVSWCPEVARLVGATQAPSEVSYGANVCSPRMQRDANKIVLMDAAEQTIEFQGEDSAAWLSQVRPRHSRQMNVLYFDGSVRLHRPEAIDPYTAEDDFAIRKRLWEPQLPCDPSEFNAAGGTGLLAEYRTTPETSTPGNWTTSPHRSRVDLDLNMPFGSGFSNGPAGADYPSNPMPNPQQPFTVTWRGQIRAPTTGQYTFWVSHDDFAWITINGESAYAQTWWNGGPWGWTAGSPVTLNGQQWVDIEVKLHQWASGGNHIRVLWEGPGLPQEDIPREAFRLAPGTVPPN